MNPYGGGIRNLADVEAIERTPLQEQAIPRNVYEALAAGAAINPDRAAIHFLREGSALEQPVTFTYRQLLGRIHQSANLFRHLGIGPTDVVSYLLPLVPQAYFVLFGAETAGIVCAVNPLLEVAQIAEILRAARTKVLVSLGPTGAPGIWEKVNAVRAQLPELKATLQVGNPDLDAGEGAQGLFSYDAWLEKFPADRLDFERDIAPEDIACYFHTGGTTGAPKLAQHTHRNQMYLIWAGRLFFGLSSPETVVAGLPMFHVSGAVKALWDFALGSTVVVLSPSGYRNPQVIKDHWKICRRYQVTSVFTVPTGFSALLNVPIEPGDLESLRWGLTGASPLPVQVAQDFERKTGCKLVEVYGMTETTGAFVGQPMQGPTRFGAVGVRYPYMQLRAVKLDPQGRVERDCKVDEIGVLLVKGPGVFPGYVQEQHNRGAFVEDGWLNTGDLGRLDADGFLWLTGRAKDLIIRGGHNIDPQVIEEALHTHPAVELAAAVGKPDGYAGELPVAYVQLKAGQSATPEQLQAYLRERIPERAANPVNLYVIPRMPQTAVGKIFKPELRWDATRRVFTEHLQDLGLQDLRVEVGADPTHGTLATVRLPGVAAPLRPATEQHVHDKLGAFAIAHRVAWE